MRAYTKRGCGKKFGLWNVVDLGYVAVQTAHAVLDGKVKIAKVRELIARRIAAKE